MKKKIIVGLIICILAGVLIMGIKLYQRETNPSWQIAKNLYNVENSLKKVDEEWKLESLSTVTPYSYVNPNGDTIIYYHCKTSYLTDEEVQIDGLNTSALQHVMDINSLENSRYCNINGMPAIIGEGNGRTYLCWTLDSENSCVLEYTGGTISEESVFRMAESVQLPQNEE